MADFRMSKHKKKKKEKRGTQLTFTEEEVLGLPPIKKSDRVSREEYFLMMAVLASSRGTCVRRKTGCVLVDKKNRVIGTGYNGVPSGMTHCIDDGDTSSPIALCPGHDAAPGEALDECFAVHAEMNAILRCSATHKIAVAYCTHTPCIHCMKLLLNTTCERIVCAERYPQEIAVRIWKNAGRRIQWKTLTEPIVIKLDHGRTLPEETQR